MKLLLLACLLGFGNASDFLKEAESSIDASILAFLQGAVRAGSLTQKMGVENPEIEQMADDLEAELGRVIRHSLKEILDKIRDHVENGIGIGQELHVKVTELKGQLVKKEDDDRESLKLIRNKAKEALRKILERLGLGKRNMDDLMDHVARMKFKELVDKIRETVLSPEIIEKIRDYIKNYYGESQLVKKLKKLVKKMTLEDIRQILDILLDYKPGQEQSSLKLRNETWDRLKNFFKGLDTKIQGHCRKFGEWVRDVWGKGIDKVKDKYSSIKAIAMEFVANSKDKSAELARESLDFFRPYKEDMGSLWNKLVEVTKEGIGRF